MKIKRWTKISKDDRRIAYEAGPGVGLYRLVDADSGRFDRIGAVTTRREAIDWVNGVVSVKVLPVVWSGEEASLTGIDSYLLNTGDDPLPVYVHGFQREGVNGIAVVATEEAIDDILQLGVKPFEAETKEAPPDAEGGGSEKALGIRCPTCGSELYQVLTAVFLTPTSTRLKMNKTFFRSKAVSVLGGKREGLLYCKVCGSQKLTIFGRERDVFNLLQNLASEPTKGGS